MGTVSLKQKQVFLIGISIDGPPEIHDKYRYDKRGRSSSEQVIRGLRILQKHNVDYNILCVVNSHNAEYPKEVYSYFKSLDAEFMQFIPAVEHFDGENVSPRSVSGKQYGKFLSTIFDEWVVNDIGKIFIQIFDIALEAWLGYKPKSVCISMKRVVMLWLLNTTVTYIPVTTTLHLTTILVTLKKPQLLIW